jgi:UDP-N-acetylglucosamine 2-epimerase (non-hydrolysing)
LKQAVVQANTEARPLYLIVLAARPCFIKLAALIHALQAGGTPHLVVDSGQHYEPVLTGARHELGYEERIEVSLGISSDLVGRTRDLAERLQQLAQLLRDLGLATPPVPVVSGDTSTAGSVPHLWYLITGHRAVHVEAGLRSEGPAWDWPRNFARALGGQRQAEWRAFPDTPFPEGMCTRQASVASQLWFAPTVRNRAHLLQEGYPDERIKVVGSLSADAVELALEHETLEQLNELYPRLGENRWLRVDVHRRENMTRPRLGAILEALTILSGEGLRIVLVRTNAFDHAIRIHRLEKPLRDAAKRGVLITPMWPSYSSVVNFLVSAQCGMIYTDSGGLQEETHVLGVPCLTARWCTDRPESVLEADNNLLLPPLSAEFLAGGIRRAWEGARRREPGRLYGHNVGAAIADQLARHSPRECAKERGVARW